MQAVPSDRRLRPFRRVLLPILTWMRKKMVLHGPRPLRLKWKDYGFREKLRRAILDPRVTYVVESIKPTTVTPATDAEYDALIHGFWDTLDLVPH